MRWVWLDLEDTIVPIVPVLAKVVIKEFYGAVRERILVRFEKETSVDSNVATNIKEHMKTTVTEPMFGILLYYQRWRSIKRS